MLVVALGTAGDAGAVGPPSAAQARMFAAAVNLTAADLPGFTTSASNPAGGADVTSSSPCQARSDRPVARVRSPDFERQDPNGLDAQFVDSTVTVWPSAHVAARRLAVLRTVRGRRCVERDINRRFKAIKHPGISYGSTSLVLRSPPASGGDALALRFKVMFSVNGLGAPLYFDVLTFRLGPAIVNLIAGALPAPVPPADEQRLFSLLLARATAHTL